MVDNAFAKQRIGVITLSKQKHLSMQHQAVWNIIRTLKDGERVLGADLRKMAGISTERAFYNVIEDLRTAGLFIGASRRNEDKGYYEIRTDDDMERFLRSKRNELQGEWKALDDLEKKWLEKQQLNRSVK